MTPEQLYVYVEEVWIQATLALQAREQFIAIVSDEKTAQSRYGWMHLQSFLAHFGMVSKYLFASGGANKRSVARAEELARHLEVDPSGALNDRQARNSIEHLDERLDAWLDRPDLGCLESVFENRAAYDYLDHSRWMVRRVYLREEDILITPSEKGNVETPLRPLADAIVGIIGACDARLG